MSKHGLLPRVMYGSMALRPTGSGVVSMAPITTEDSADVQGLVSHLK